MWPILAARAGKIRGFGFRSRQILVFNHAMQIEVVAFNVICAFVQHRSIATWIFITCIRFLEKKSTKILVKYANTRAQSTKK